MITLWPATQTRPAAHNPVVLQAALLIQRSPSWTEPALLCSPRHWRFPPKLLWEALFSLEPARFLSQAPQEHLAAHSDAQLLLHGAAQSCLLRALPTHRQQAAPAGATPTLLSYLTPVPNKDRGNRSSCLPLTGTQSDSPCSQHLVSLTRQENKRHSVSN